MNKEILRMQMLSGIITESEYKAKLKKNKSPLNENLKFSQIEKDRKYFATTNFGIFKKGDEVFVDTVRNLGNEVVIELSNNKEQSDSIKGDLEDEVEVFDNDMKESLNENFVGIGMVGNIFDRKKTDYEIAFEHFSKGKMNEEMSGMNSGVESYLLGLFDSIDLGDDFQEGPQTYTFEKINWADEDLYGEEAEMFTPAYDYISSKSNITLTDPLSSTPVTFSTEGEDIVASFNTEDFPGLN
jgi:hypothetical protein